MKTSIIVQNLKCGGCTKTITGRLSALKNISNVRVDEGSAKVSFDSENKNDVLTVKRKLRALGYPSIDNKNSMVAKAVSFVSCATGKLSK